MTFHTNHPTTDMTLGYSADCFFSASATVELFVPVREREREEVGGEGKERKTFEFGEMMALLLWPSQTPAPPPPSLFLL